MVDFFCQDKVKNEPAMVPGSEQSHRPHLLAWRLGLLVALFASTPFRLVLRLLVNILVLDRGILLGHAARDLGSDCRLGYRGGLLVCAQGFLDRDALVLGLTFGF